MDQVRRQIGDPIELFLGKSVLNSDILPLKVAKIL